MIKYQKWLSKNTKSLENKLALVVGATGSIGNAIVDYLLYLKAEVIIAGRNENKIADLKAKMALKYPDGLIHTAKLDVSSLKSIDEFQLDIDKRFRKINIFINNAGVYHLPSSISEDGFEIHFATNTVGNYYLTKKIMYNLDETAKLIFTGSISYNFYKYEFNDNEGFQTKNKMKIYGISKRLMMQNNNYLKEALKQGGSKMEIVLTHPGICATNLFNAGHSKFFLKVIHPLMKVIFHNPYKASLSTIKAIFNETETSEWYGPRGLFQVWGYPSKHKLTKKVYELKPITEANSLIKEVLLETKK